MSEHIRGKFAGTMAALLVVALLGAGCVHRPPVAAGPQYQIAVCDWMILKRQKLGAFQLAKDIGADGVEVDMGSLGNRETFENKLSDPAARAQFLAQARELGLQISSLAMSGFYAQSFAGRTNGVALAQSCLETMRAMRVKTAFLPLGVQGDLVKFPELRPVIMERLRLVGKLAEPAGVVIGIETSLSAADEAKLLDEIGSPAVKSYFNFANAVKGGRDVCAELRTLGAKRICQIHCTDGDGVWLQNDPKINMPQVKQTLDRMGWHGWLVIERSRDAANPRNVKRNFTANTVYLKSVFQKP